MWVYLSLAGLAAVYFFKNQIQTAVVTPVAQVVADKVNDVLATDIQSNWTRYDQLFANYGAVYDVDPNYLKAFALNESRLGLDESVATGLANPNDVEGSKSSDGKSWGLMQVTLSTGRDFDPSITPQKLNDPEYSIDIAAHFISTLQRAFPPSDHPRNLEWMVKSYNQGVGNTRKEIAGQISGYAGGYWDRWQRNYNTVLGA